MMTPITPRLNLAKLLKAIDERNLDSAYVLSCAADFLLEHKDDPRVREKYGAELAAALDVFLE